VFAVAEGFLTAAFAAAGIPLTTPFVRMTYDEAIKNYGIDKPDMRLPAMVSLTEELTPELREKLRIEQALPVLGFVIPDVGELSGTARKALLSEVRGGFGDCGLDLLDVARLKTSPDFAPLAAEIEAKLRGTNPTRDGEAVTNGAPGSSTPGSGGDLVVVVTPKLGTPAMWNYDPQWIWKRVGQLRLELAKKYADKHKRFEQTGTAADFKFCWVTDFPMYEWNEESKTWDAAHHPFTSPHEDDIKAGRLTSDKGAVRALAYDIVLNGTELGSGSIRIHRQDVQAEIFRSLGMTDEEAHARFGFFLDALEYGTPPHGGIALGLDRIVMILAGASSLREVIAFPKTAKAIDLMVDAPTPATEQQLRELHLRIAGRT
jgi:aspartyl-tRNA synthetase